jgi:hypothetical protein
MASLMQNLLLWMLLVCTIGPCFGKDQTGRTLLEELQLADRMNSRGDLSAGDCVKVGVMYGLIIGVADTGANVFFTPPANWNPKIGQEVLRKYLQENPDKLDQYATALIIQSMQAAYPLQKANP